MKKGLIFAMIAIVFIACNSGRAENNSKPVAVRHDTTSALISYKSAVDTNVYSGVWHRVVNDSLMYVYADTNYRNDRHWVKDTFYLIKYYLPIDSATAKRMKLPMRDSIGRTLLYPTNWIRTDKQFVRSGWDNYDSAVSQLKRMR